MKLDEQIRGPPATDDDEAGCWDADCANTQSYVAPPAWAEQSGYIHAVSKLISCHICHRPVDTWNVPVYQLRTDGSRLWPFTTTAQGESTGATWLYYENIAAHACGPECQRMATVLSECKRLGPITLPKRNTREETQKQAGRPAKQRCRWQVSRTYY